MPCTAFAYMSVMTYFETTSAALRVDDPGHPGARAVRITSRNGVMIGSSFHSACFDHSRVAGIEKPFCEMNHRSSTSPELPPSRTGRPPPLHISWTCVLDLPCKHHTGAGARGGPPPPPATPFG